MNEDDNDDDDDNSTNRKNEDHGPGESNEAYRSEFKPCHQIKGCIAIIVG